MSEKPKCVKTREDFYNMVCSFGACRGGREFVRTHRSNDPQVIWNELPLDWQCWVLANGSPKLAAKCYEKFWPAAVTSSWTPYGMRPTLIETVKSLSWSAWYVLYHVVQHNDPDQVRAYMRARRFIQR